MNALTIIGAILETTPAANPAVEHVQAGSLFSLAYSPITVKGVLACNARLLKVYAEDLEPAPAITPEGPKRTGSAIGTIYRLAHDRILWLGKINGPSGLAPDLETDFALSGILEKIAYDVYKVFGRKLFGMPRTFLCDQPVLDRFQTNIMAEIYANEAHVERCLRIFCRYVEGYCDFSEAQTRFITAEGVIRTLSFVDFINEFHIPPETLLTPTGQSVPLKGIVELIAVIRAIADYDGLGSPGKNAGFVWEYEPAGQIIAAKTVKIDPGFAFSFKEQDTAVNQLLATLRREGSPDFWLNDLRDIQTGGANTLMTIHFRSLTDAQKDIFLSTLMNCLRYINNPGVLNLLIHRQGKFYRNNTAQMAETISAQLTSGLIDWLRMQEEIYRADLQEFQTRYPEELLAIQYIDRYGELPLPATNGTFPIRELYTTLVLVQTEEIQREEEVENPQVTPSLLDRNPRLTNADSLYSLSESSKETPIELCDLFTPSGEDLDRNEISKVLVLGAAGIGKSTLCQKIAHDWATYQLWNEYQAVYWLPLRKCNHAACLIGEVDSQQWLVKALAELVLESPFLIDSLRRRLETHRRELLILLDGYDEATPEVKAIVETLLRQPGINILITSRPGDFTLPVERTVETRGFSQSQVTNYASRFFERSELFPSPTHIQEQSMAFFVALKSNPTCAQIAHIPLHLQMLCTLWERQRNAGLPTNLTKLYQSMVAELFGWHCRKTADNLQQYQEPIFALLGLIGYRGLQRGRLLIPEAIIQDSLAPYSQPKIDQLLASGLLKWSETGEYSFLHLTFQEYLIAHHISLQQPEVQKQFVLEHRNLPQFQLVLSFLAGSLSSRGNNLEQMQEFFGWLHSPGADLTGFYQSTLALRCLNECEDPDLHRWFYGTYHLMEAYQAAMEEWINTAFKVNSPNIPRLIATLSRQVPTASKPLLESCCEVLLHPPSNVWGRKSAVEAFRLIERVAPPEQIPRILAFLSQSICNADARVGIAALETLERIAQVPENASTVAAILGQAVWGERMNLRIHVLKTLTKIGELTPIPQLSQIIASCNQLMKDKEWRRRQVAVEALGKLAIVAPPEQIRQIIGLLGQAMQDASQYVSRSAVEAFVEVAKVAPPGQIPAVIALLSKAMSSKNKNVRSKAVDALGGIAQVPQIMHLLNGAMRDADKDVRRSAVKVLGEASRIAPPELIPQITALIFRAMRDGSEDVRSNGAEALGNASEVVPDEQIPQITVLLVQAMEDVHKKVRLTAAGALGRVAKIAPPEQISEIITGLGQALEDVHHHVRQGVVETLGSVAKIISPKQIPEVVYLLVHAMHDGYVKSRVVNVLEEVARITPPQQLPEIISALGQAMLDENVRTCATEALGRIAPLVPPEHTSQIIALLVPAMEDADLFCRMSALHALGRVAKFVPKEQISEIIALLGHSIVNAHIMQWQYKTTAQVLVEIARVVPTEQIPSIIVLLNQIASGLLEIYLLDIPLHGYLDLLNRPEWDQYVDLIPRQAALRLSPLEVIIEGSKINLCIIENGQRHTLPINPGQLQRLQEACAKMPLSTYTISYTDS